MTNRVVLKYEDNVFKVDINDKTVASGKDMDKIIEKFKQVFRDNSSNSAVDSWESIFERVKRFSYDELEINEQYKTISYKSMKYFYNSNNIFYVKENDMTPLNGGYDLFEFILRVVTEGFNEYEKILIFCEKMIENHINYRTSDSTIVVSSPGFSYGYLEYNFYNKKISKGIAVESGSFDEFTTYVEENL